MALTSKKTRVLLLTHSSLVPPNTATTAELKAADWRAEYDVVQTLRNAGHEVLCVGISDEVGAVRKAVYEFRPHVAFNLTEEFDGVGFFDQNIVSYLELLKIPYTGCNPRGLMLARDKSLAKKILSFHGLPTPSFEVFPRGGGFKRPAHLTYPAIVKAVNEEASLGISQASIVTDEEKLEERVNFVHEHLGTDAIAEAYIEGRELYVGVLGNMRPEALPVWEMFFPSSAGWPIATRRVKWNANYREKHGIYSGEARELPAELAAKVKDISRRVYRVLGLNGYARMDLRLTSKGEIHVIEANPNPHIGKEEDFAQSALKAGLTYSDLLWRILNLGLRWRPAAE
ncbi:ATP-grasp domain-containing protein [bacterium]|nr:ATP-grasp domain-containing protein [bacterium]